MAFRADAILNRARILDAARGEFAQHGMRAEISRIANAAGVATGTIYRHFTNKDGLAAAVIQELAERFTQDLARALESPDPVEALATLIRRGFDLLDAYGELLVMVLASPPGTYARGRADYDTLRAQLGELLQRGVDRGEFRADLNVDYAVAVFGGLFTPRALPRLRATQPLDAIAEAGVSFFLAGVGSSRIPAPPAAEHQTPDSFGAG